MAAVGATVGAVLRAWEQNPFLQTRVVECKSQGNALFPCPSLMPATEETTPPGALIARYDKKNQLNPSQDLAMTDPLWRPEKTRAGQTTLAAFSVWMAS